MIHFSKNSSARAFAIAMIIPLIILLVCAMWFMCNNKSEDVVECKPSYYALTAQVVEIDKTTDVVTCEDSNGNLWDFYGVEDWQEGDCISLLMNTNGTADIYDDTICGTTYGTWDLSRQTV